MTFIHTGIPVVIASILISMVNADRLYCLSCKSVISPRHCHTVEKCADGEFCYTEKIVDINGQELYNTGCQEETFCNSTTNPMSNTQPFGNPFGVLNRNFQPHFAECTECCASDVCNQHGCGSSGYPLQRGPLCFNCPQSNNPSLCSTVDVCNIDEVCHIHLEREFGDAFYSQSCQKKRSCLRQETTSIFGKRSEQSCTNCCERDLCNIRMPICFQVFDCWELYQKGIKTSGVYKINPWRDSRSVEVYCDMDTAPAGWTVFQRRNRDSYVSFNKSWTEYRNGFGNVMTDYWLGNEIIHQLTTATPNLLFLTFKDTDENSYEEIYSYFYMDNQVQYYKLNISSGNGTAGSLLEDNYKYRYFNTYDRDGSYHCARTTGAGWWYYSSSYCTSYVNLNVDFFDQSFSPWSSKVSAGKLLSTKMMITRSREF